MSGLRESEQGPTDRLRLRQAFVVVQVAVSLVLVISAGLFTRALQRAGTIDAGYEPRGVEAAALDLSMAGYTSDSGPAFARNLVERTRRLPGVRAATLAYLTPQGGREIFCCGVTVPGVTPPLGQPYFMPHFNSVEPGYFDTLGIPLLAGRDFGPADRPGSQRVAIISDESARQLWPGQDPLGKTLLWHQTPPGLGAADARPPLSLVVVGVARHLRAGRPGDRQPLFVYVPLQQEFRPRVTLLARTTPGQRPTREMRLLIAALNSSLPVLHAWTLVDQASPVVVNLRVAAAVAGVVGTIGAFLAAVGIYGVTAYMVSRRTREIGIRLALGARPRDVAGIVLREGLGLVLTGAVIGLVLAAGASRAMAGALFGFPATDAMIFAGAAVLLAGVGLAACYVPTRRAMRVKAIEALRAE